MRYCIVKQLIMKQTFHTWGPRKLSLTQQPFHLSESCKISFAPSWQRKYVDCVFSPHQTVLMRPAAPPKQTVHLFSFFFPCGFLKAKGLRRQADWHSEVLLTQGDLNFFLIFFFLSCNAVKWYRAEPKWCLRNVAAFTNLLFTQPSGCTQTVVETELLQLRSPPKKPPHPFCSSSSSSLIGGERFYSSPFYE